MGKKEDSAAKDKCRTITPEFRVSYPHLWKPNAMKGSAPKYSVTMLFKKTQDLVAIKAVIKNAKIAEFGDDKANWPDDLESPVIDGDLPKYADKEGYKGCWVIKASSHEQARPTVVDANVDEIVNPADLYPGCYARAQVFARVWTHDETNRQGIHFILDHVQKTKDGKSFSGKKAASEVFSPLTGGESESSEESDDFM